MPLPSEVRLRRVSGAAAYDDGSVVGSGSVTVQAVPRELIYRPTAAAPAGAVKTSIFTRPITVQVAAGLFTFPNGLLCWNDPNLDAGNGHTPWSYSFSRSWDRTHPYLIAITRGPLGTIADAPLDVADLIAVHP